MRFDVMSILKVGLSLHCMHLIFMKISWLCIAHWLVSLINDVLFLFFVSPELSSVRDYVITHSVRSMCMYVVFCKIDHCIHIHWCIVMGLGHNDPWVESHMWPRHGVKGHLGVNDLWFKFLEKRVSVSHTLICIFKSNITMIAKVCDHEIRRDSWFENRLVLIL